MMTIRSDGSLIETVITKDGDDPLVAELNLYASGGGGQWECFVTLLDPQMGRRTYKARVTRLELDLEMDE